MDHQTRRRDAVGGAQRAGIPQRRPVVVIAVGHVEVAEPEADVGCSGERREVVEASLGYRAPESMLGGQDLGGDQPPVRAAHDPHAVGVQSVVLLDDRVDRGQQIVKVRRSFLVPPSESATHEVVAPAARTTRIGGDDSVAGAHVHLELVEERPSVLSRRSPVDVEEHRHLVVTRWQVHPHVEVDAAGFDIPGRQYEVVRLDQTGVRPEVGVHLGERPLFACLEPGQLARVGHARRRERDRAPVGSRGHAGDEASTPEDLEP